MMASILFAGTFSFVVTMICIACAIIGNVIMQSHVKRFILAESDGVNETIEKTTLLMMIDIGFNRIKQDIANLSTYKIS
jgi:hypothetical protein